MFPPHHVSIQIGIIYLRLGNDDGCVDVDGRGVGDLLAHIGTLNLSTELK